MSAEDAAKREAVLSRLRARRETSSPTSTETRDTAAREDEVSFGQERLWFLEKFNLGMPAYNEGFRIDFEVCPDIPRLAAALDATVARHEALRTHFKNEASYIRQVIEPTLGPILEVEEPLKSISSELEAAEISRRVIDFIRHPFDLERGPLLRAKLFVMHEGGCVLAFANHHAICDAHSRAILLNDLQRSYRGASEFTTPAQFRSFSRRQRSAAILPQTAKKLKRFKEALDDAPRLRLPFSPPSPIKSNELAGARVELVIGRELIQEIEIAARDFGATPYMMLVAAWTIVLARSSGASEIVVGIPADARSTDESGMVGFGISVVPIRILVDLNATIAEHINHVREQVLTALESQDVSFEQIVEAVNPPRNLGQSPIFQTMISLESPTPSFDLGSCKGKVSVVDIGISRLELTLEVSPKGGDWLCALAYRRSFSSEEASKSIAHRFVLALKSFIQSPQVTIGSINLTSNEEKFKILESWSKPKWPATHGDDVVKRLQNRCAESSSKRAIKALDVNLNYLQLSNLVMAWAVALTNAGCKHGERVALSTGHNAHLPAAIFAIWYVGGVYVPIDQNMSPDRMAAVVADAGLRIAVCETANLKQMRSAGITTCVTPDTLSNGVSGVEILRPANVHPEEPAYVIYTSGSTGRPKGVIVSRGNLASFLTSMDELLIRTDRQVWLASTSISFDISLLELVWTLTAGMELIMAPERPVIAPVSTRHGRKGENNLNISLFFFAADAERESDDRYSLLIESARFADSAGFEAIWTPERHFHPFGGLYPNPSVISAALARETKRIALRAGSVVAPLHHPIRIAEDWSIVDNLSNGRIGVALASGWHAEDFVFAPDSFKRRYEVLEETVFMLRTLWAGGTAEFKNGIGSDTTVKIFPTPVQTEIPLWLTASGSKETFAMAGRLDAGVLTHLIGQSFADAASNIKIYQGTRAEYGHVSPSKATLMLHTHVTSRPRDVDIHAALVRYFTASADLVRSLAVAAGQGDVAGISEANLKAIVEQAVHRHVSTSSLIGPIDKGIKISRQAFEAGFTEIACLIDFGLGDEAVIEGLQTLAELREAMVKPNPYQSSDRGAVMVDPEITHAQFTPTLLRSFLNSEGGASALARLNTLLIGGEALTNDLVNQIRQTGIRAVNIYGPTEATVWATAHEVTEAEQASVIGKPLTNVRAYLLDNKRQIIGPGLVGDLWLSGPQIALGYLGREEETSSAFLPDPYSDTIGDLMYRTGDQAVWNYNGELIFLGRADGQIKLHGIRLELSEIESLFKDIPGISDCAVLLEPHNGEDSLSAYIVMKDGFQFDPDAFRKSVRKKATSGQVPSRIFDVPEIPRTLSGKLDRRSLGPSSTKKGSVVPSVRYALPPTRKFPDKLVAELVAIWQDELKIENHDVAADFFDVGGNSLAAARLVAKLRNRFNVEVPLVEFFEVPTLQNLIELVTDRMDISHLRNVDNAD